MPNYKKCPRCDLNYIPEDEELCEVCKAELRLVPSSPLLDDGYDDDSILCPICKMNYISPEEEMCYQCAERLKYDDDHASVLDEDEDDSWRVFLDDEKEIVPDEMGDLSLADLEEEEKGDEEEEEEEEPVDHDIFLDDLDEDVFDDEDDLDEDDEDD